MTSNARSTEPGQPYEMKYMDPFGNVKTRLVNLPAVLSEFFLVSNTIDCHNQSQQHDLALEKCWHTRDAYVTMLIGTTTTDCCKLAEFHGFTNWGQKQATIGIQFFAGTWESSSLIYHPKFPKSTRFHPLFQLAAIFFLLQLFKLQRAPIFHQLQTWIMLL
jgi:hypothetical protein